MTPPHLVAAKLRAPVTPNTVDRVARGLLQSIQETARSIAMAEAAADALAPIAHYKKADSRACKRIMDACPGIRLAKIVRDEHGRGGPGYFASLYAHSGESGTRIGYAYICAWLPESACSVADLIAVFRACKDEKARLARLRAQYEQLENLIDAEEQVRRLVQEIESIRQETALAVVGDSYPLYHESVQDELPGIAGR